MNRNITTTKELVNYIENYNKNIANHLAYLHEKIDSYEALRISEEETIKIKNEIKVILKALTIMEVINPNQMKMAYNWYVFKINK